MTSAAGAWIDGRPATQALLFDRGLHYGDGLFETLLLRAGRARFLALHAARLTAGCERLGIPCDANAALQDALAALSPQAQDAGDGTLKVIVTRGDAVARGYGTQGTERARVLSLWYPGPVPVAPGRFEVRLLQQRWGENPALAGMKHLNRLEQVLARRELAATGADEGLVASSSGLLVSGTMSNVFLWREEGLVTPRVDRCGIAGVMRAVVMREAQRRALPVRETDVPLGEVLHAQALCFTNARMGLRLATGLEGRALALPAALTALCAAVEQLDA